MIITLKLEYRFSSFLVFFFSNQWEGVHKCWQEITQKFMNWSFYTEIGIIATGTAVCTHSFSKEHMLCFYVLVHCSLFCLTYGWYFQISLFCFVWFHFSAKCCVPSDVDWQIETTRCRKVKIVASAILLLVKFSTTRK